MALLTAPLLDLFPSPTPLSSSLFPAKTLAILTATCLVGLLSIHVLGRIVAWTSFSLLLGENGAKDTKRQLKFTSAFLEFVVYTCGFIWGLPLITTQEWFWPSAKWWLDTPSATISSNLALFYLVYASRYIALLVVVLCTERKKDFMEMVFHHVVTAALVLLSYCSGFVRVGLVIMVLFDAADPLLHGAKLINYWKEASPKDSVRKRFFATGADIVFGSFAVAFFITRIVMYSYVVFAVTYESVVICTGFNHQGDVATQFSIFMNAVKLISVPHVLCITLVWVLYGLQWFWWLILWELIKKTLRGEELKDSRSDDDAHDKRD